MVLALCEILYQPVAWNGNMVEYLIKLHIHQLPWGAEVRYLYYPIYIN